MRQTNNVVFCQYCNLPAELVDGDLIYPGVTYLKHKPFWLCKRDNAYVGCKPGTTEPTGALANEAERNRRKTAYLRKKLWNIPKNVSAKKAKPVTRDS